MSKIEQIKVSSIAEPDTQFDLNRAKEDVYQLMEKRLNGKSYNPDEFGRICKELADEVRESVLNYSDNRSKVLVQITVIQQGGQGIRMATRSYYDIQADKQFSVTFKTADCIAIALVGVFYYY